MVAIESDLEDIGSLQMKKQFHHTTVAIFVTTLGLLAWSPSGFANSLDKSLILRMEDMKLPPGFKTSPEKVELGKMLYFDPRLSSTSNISCNSCHNVMAGGEDGMGTSLGVGAQRGGRNAPTVWNSGFLSVQFWDGRANTLEDQAKGPITNPVEMGMKDHAVAVARISEIEGYRQYFAKVYGGKPSAKGIVTIDRIADSIAAYERTLVTLNSPFDRFLSGESGVISEEAKKGWQTMQTIGCTSCHSGSAFAGPAMPLGVGFYQKFPLIGGKATEDLDKKYGFTKDQGRFEVTKQDADKNMFRVPTLRNVAVTAPYFHNGAVDELSEAVQVMAQAQLGKTLSKAEVKSIVAFLETLTGEFPAQTLPRLPMISGKTSSGASK